MQGAFHSNGEYCNGGYRQDGAGATPCGPIFWHFAIYHAESFYEHYRRCKLGSCYYTLGLYLTGLGMPVSLLYLVPRRKLIATSFV